MNRVYQNLVTFIVGAASSVALLLIRVFPDWRVLVATIVVWLALLVFAERYMRRLLGSHYLLLPILITTSLSFVGLFSLIEWPVLYWLLIVLAGLVMAILFRLIFEVKETLNLAKQKPYRRMMMLLWVFDAYAISTTLFAVSLFFPEVSFWVLVILSGVVYAYISFMIWRMYFNLKFKKNWLWLSIVTLFMIELVWVMHLLPYGYLASGLLVTWVWYMLQLFIRFHFGPKGVVWKKQTLFLISNVVLYCLILLFFVRWV